MDDRNRNCNLPPRAVQDHRRSYSDFLYVYPVISRRSRGLSIGVNLNPDKICNFDCIYCEVDRLTPPRVRTVDVNVMRDELVKVVHLIKRGELSLEPRFESADISEIKDIAFSGDGEPTMVDNFSDFVAAVADVRKREALDSTKIVLITNAAGLDKADVRKGLEIMDKNNGEIWAKLDAGTEAYYKLVNRTNIKFDRILNNIFITAKARPIIIQSLFLKVYGNIIPDNELNEYCARLNELVSNGARIKEVHAYTVARPTPEPFATKLNSKELAEIAQKIRAGTNLAVFEFP
ncbi:MAG: radical SAM protein [Verrucomicrobiia bacterium]